MGWSDASGKPLEKRDYWILGLIVAFSVYGYIVMDDILAALLDTSGNSELSGPFLLLVTVVPLMIFATVLFGFSRGVWADTRLGLRFFTGWRAVGAYGVLIVAAYGLYSQGLEALVMSRFLQYVPLILNVIAGELVLRAMLVDVICKVSSNAWLNIPLAFVLSGLLFFGVFLQFQPGPIESFWWEALWLGSAALIYGTEKANLFVVWICVDGYRVAKHAGVPEYAPLALYIATLVVVFALITAAWFLFRSRSQGAPAGEVVT